MDSQTRNKLKQMFSVLNVSSDDNAKHELENFTDWVYDLAYRKGWQHGLWKKEPDLSYQTSGLARKNQLARRK